MNEIQTVLSTNVTTTTVIPTEVTSAASIAIESGPSLRSLPNQQSSYRHSFHATTQRARPNVTKRRHSIHDIKFHSKQQQQQSSLCSSSSSTSQTTENLRPPSSNVRPRSVSLDSPVAVASTSESSSSSASVVVSKRTHVASEIFTSEQRYVANLVRIFSEHRPCFSTRVCRKEILVERYVKPITTEEAGLLDVHTRRALLCPLTEILAVHRFLLHALGECVSAWNDDTSKIGDVFLRFVPYFKLYSDYCANYNSFHNTVRLRVCRVFWFFFSKQCSVVSAISCERNSKIRRRRWQFKSA